MRFKRTQFKNSIFGCYEQNGDGRFPYFFIQKHMYSVLEVKHYKQLDFMACFSWISELRDVFDFFLAKKTSPQHSLSLGGTL